MAALTRSTRPEMAAAGACGRRRSRGEKKGHAPSDLHPTVREAGVAWGGDDRWMEIQRSRAEGAARWSGCRRIEIRWWGRERARVRERAGWSWAGGQGGPCAGEREDGPAEIRPTD